MRPSNSFVASIVACVLVVLTAALLILSVRMRATVVELNNTTDRAVKAGDEISGLFSGEVNSILGFQAKGEPQYSQTYERQRTSIDDRMKALEKVAASLGPAVQAYFKELQSAVDDWHNSVDTTGLTTRRLTASDFRLLTFDRLFMMRRAQAATSSFNEAVLQLQAVHRSRLQRIAYLFTALAVIFGPIGLSALVFLTHILRRVNTATVSMERRAGEEELLRHAEEALRHVGHSLTGGLTVNDVLRRVVEGAALLTQADTVCIETVDPARNETMCAAGRGSNVPPTGTTCAYTGSLAREVLQAGQPRIIQNVDVEGQPDSTFRDLVRRSDGRSAMVIPLITENRPLGAMCLLRGAPKGFTYGDVPNMRILGEMASIALHRALTVERLQRFEDEERFLVEASTTLASSLDYQRTLQTVARVSLPRMGDWCVLHLVEGRRLYHAEIACADPTTDGSVAEGLRAAHRERPDLPVSVETAVRTRHALLIRDVSDELMREFSTDENHLRVLRQLEVKSAMVVPLTIAQEAVGALVFLATASRRYADDDLRCARKFARTAARAIHNAQLYAVANNAVQSRDEVLRAVAHDLRNPLNAIGLSAHLLTGGSVPYERQQKLLRSITGASQRMNRLIEDLLTIGRLRAGQKIPLDLHREDPADIVEHVCEMLGPLAAEKSVTLRSSKPWTPMPAIVVDRSRILQALTNLLDNALKFTPAGGTITVSCEGLDGRIRFAVKDTGSGIEPADLEKIFDPFWQARGSAHRGAGLGLAIAKAIVEHHHGRISVESQLGVGTTVSLVLPAADAAQAVPPKAA